MQTLHLNALLGSLPVVAVHVDVCIKYLALSLYDPTSCFAYSGRIGALRPDVVMFVDVVVLRIHGSISGYSLSIDSFFV